MAYKNIGVEALAWNLRFGATVKRARKAHVTPRRPNSLPTVGLQLERPVTRDNIPVASKQRRTVSERDTDIDSVVDYVSL